MAKKRFRKPPEMRKKTIHLGGVYRVIKYAFDNGIYSKSTIASSMKMTTEQLEEKIKEIEKISGVKFPPEWTSARQKEIVVNYDEAEKIQERIQDNKLDKFSAQRELIINAIKLKTTFEKMAEIFFVSKMAVQTFAEYLLEKGAISNIPPECYKTRADRERAERVEEIDQIVESEEFKRLISTMGGVEEDDEEIDLSTIDISELKF